MTENLRRTACFVAEQEGWNEENIDRSNQTKGEVKKLDLVKKLAEKRAK